ncbi:MAG TPA: protein kinase [Thermoanaerobaculia bacterium]
MTLPAGAKLGPYEVLSPLGAGGMGEVYRARDTRLGREVAVKVLPASLSTDPDRLRRFEQEARAAGVLNHPNITAVHDIGTHEGAPYVVQELLEGESLRSVLAGGCLSPRKSIDYAIQVAQGLAAAHEKGIVHRDLKPDNLFVTKDGRVKILDFGLAKLTRQGGQTEEQTGAPTQTATQPDVVLGTLGYMPPEQLRGQPTDQRSDIFSFGAILYEMLTGQRAFRGVSTADTISSILREEPPLSGARANASPALERIVRRCLEKSPEERFQSARDLAFALQEASSASLPLRFVASPPPRSRSVLWPMSLGLAALLAVLFAVNVGHVRERLFGRGHSGRIHSLAVLPLANLTADSGEDYFVDGMTEALIADLAKIEALRVISRTSVMRYKGTRKPLPEIARELNVDAVVEGSVLRSGDRVRITAQLIDAPTDRHLWAESYERGMRDVLTLQSEIARAIAGEIRIKITPQERTRLAGSRPLDPEAHDLYLKGRYHWNKKTAEGFQKAREYFEGAIAKEPTYAAAYAGLADTYSGLGYYVLAPREAMPKARAAALKALELDDTLAEAHASLGNVRHNFDWDWTGAEKSFRRAIELNPGYATAHQWYSLHLGDLGRSEQALVEARRALELDPLSLIVNHNLGLQHCFARQFDQAIAQYEKTLEMDPNFAVTHWALGSAYGAKGMYPEAVAELERLRALTGRTPSVIAYLGNVRARSGERQEALRLLEELETISKQKEVSAELAILYAGLGDRDRAFACLEKAYAERSGAVPGLKVYPEFEPLRSDPRFADLLRRLGLPP